MDAKMLTRSFRRGDWLAAEPHVGALWNAMKIDMGISKIWGPRGWVFTQYDQDRSQKANVLKQIETGTSTIEAGFRMIRMVDSWRDLCCFIYFFYQILPIRHYLLLIWEETMMSTAMTHDVLYPFVPGTFQFLCGYAKKSMRIRISQHLQIRNRCFDEGQLKLLNSSIRFPGFLQEGPSPPDPLDVSCEDLISGRDPKKVTQ